MNEKELIGKIHSSMYHQLQVRGYAAPVDVLIDTGILPKQRNMRTGGLAVCGIWKLSAMPT